MNFFISLILFALISSESKGLPINPKLDTWWNSSYPYQERVDALIAELTSIEKIALLDYDAQEIPRLGIPAYNYWSEGTHGVAFAGVATVFPSPLALAATFDVNYTSRWRFRLRCIDFCFSKFTL